MKFRLAFWVLTMLICMLSEAYGQVSKTTFTVNVSAAQPARIKTNSNNTGSTTSPLITQAALITTVINMPGQGGAGPVDANNTYDPKITSNNTESPIVLTSSDPTVAIILADGRIKMLKPGVTTITATQAASANYTSGTASQLLTITETLSVYLPAIAAKTLCSADFNVNGIAYDNVFPVKYVSSNTAVATINADGLVHITGTATGTVTITLSQPALAQYYVDAAPKSQTFNVTVPVSPAVNIATTQVNTCPGTAITFTAAVQNAGAAPKYQWQLNGVNIGINSNTFVSSTVVTGDKVTCIVTNTDNSCISTYPSTSNVIAVTRATTIPTVSIAASANSVFAGTAITLTATVKGAVGAVSYQWFVNGTPVGTNSATFTSDSFNNNDVVTCAVTPLGTCNTPATSNSVKILIAVKVDVPNAFTPNGDGVNDKWQISGIGSYPNCLVNIYDRYGKMVYQSHGYADAWNGNMNGRAVPAATYYYVIDLGIKRQVMSGYITVIR